MKRLVLLYWGCIFLMYLSQTYYPVKTQLVGPQTVKRHFMLRHADIFMIIAIVWMTCFSFLRTNYNDTYNYIYAFQNSESLIEGFQRGIFTDWTGNPWSELYESVMRSITDNYHIYFLIPALLSSYAVIKLFKNYSVSPTFSLLIFFSIGTYVMYVAALKQCIAMFFLLMAFPYAIDKKYVRFYLLVLVAVLFHTHAFMFAIVPLLVGKPWGKVTWGLLAVTIFSMATYDATLGRFMNYAQSIGAMVSEIEVFDGHQINILRVLVYWIPVILTLVFRRRLFNGSSTRAEYLFTNMSIVSAFILTIGLVQGANLYARMAAYFEIATAVALPWIIKKLFTKQSAQYITIIACVLYFGYFMFEFSVSKSFNTGYSAITLWKFFTGLVR